MDALGNPIAFLLSGGQVHDSKMAIPLLQKVDIAHSNILADRAYGSAEIRSYIESRHAKYVIPPMKNAKKLYLIKSKSMV